MRTSTHHLRNDGLTGRHLDGSSTVRGYAYSVLTAYTEWDDIVLYDDHVKITTDHPFIGKHHAGDLMVVWITQKPGRSNFTIHHQSAPSPHARNFYGGMRHADTLDEALDAFHLARGHQSYTPSLF